MGKAVHVSQKLLVKYLALLLNVRCIYLLLLILECSRLSVCYFLSTSLTICGIV